MLLPGPRGPIIDLGLSNHIIPSGIHVGAPSGFITAAMPQGLSEFEQLPKDSPVTIEITNPMPRTYTVAAKVEEVGSDGADKYLFSTMKEGRLVRLQDITEYGELLKRAAEWLQKFPCDGVIVPLRGGVKPFTQLDVLTEFKHSPCWLPFTQGANYVNHEQIREILKQYVEPRMEDGPARLVVIDTADSGHSSHALATILKELHSGLPASTKWVVDFVLFFESEGGKKPCPPLSRSIPTLNTDRLRFRVYACGTTSLLAEDWDEALGVRATWDSNGKPHIAVIPSKGRIIVQSCDDSLKEYETERLDQFVDELLANEVSDAVVTDEHLRHERDVWHKYGRDEA